MGGGLTVIAASVHGLLRPTCNRNDKLLAAGSTEIKPSAVYGNFRKFRTLWPWPWIGSSHISMHNTCRTTNLPNHVTVVSRSTEIWPFDYREISTFRKVW